MNEWISIKDKTPEQLEKEIPNEFCCHEAVLVCAHPARTGPSPLISMAIYGDGEWEILGGMGSHSDTGFYEMESKYITHWKRIDLPKDLFK
jgi:hypothetical protein